MVLRQMMAGLLAAACCGIRCTGSGPGPGPGPISQGFPGGMGNSTPMRLKVIPEDFQVQEATNLRITRRPARYRVYLLEKTGWNTVDALLRIARDRGVPFARFAYGGKKDRHAYTVQYVTVDHRADLSTQSRGYALRFLGYSPDPMGPDRILYNRFTLTVRDLSSRERERLVAGLDGVREQGYVNYFDDQRFGSSDPERGFVAERMLRGEWEEALAIALTAIYPGEAKEARDRKRALRERWGDWSACLALAQTRMEREAFRLLTAAAAPDSLTAACQQALAAFPREQQSLWAAAYQSFLWNEWVGRLLQQRGWIGAEARGRAGTYRFPGRLAPAEGAELARWQLPLPGRGLRLSDPALREPLMALLAERGLHLAALSSHLPVPGVVLRVVPRQVVVVPQTLAVTGPEPDERYPGRERVTLSFALPRGSYATMLIKAAALGPPA